MRWSKRARRIAGQLACVCAISLASTDAAAELTPLRTAAALSSRPKACTPSSPEQANPWRQVRAASESRARLCARIAQIGRLLREDPRAAAKLFETTATTTFAQQTWRGPEGLEAAFRIVQGRVALANGQARIAYDLFSRSANELPISEWDPGALRDYAVSAVTEGRYEEVIGVYRRLVAVSAWLDAQTRAAVRLEATMASLRLAQSDPVEVFGYLSGLEATDSDSVVASFAAILQSLVRSVVNGAAVSPIHPSVSLDELRRLARLSVHDWRFIESWLNWVNARDAAVWSWTSEEGVSDVYRSLAQRLIRGG